MAGCHIQVNATPVRFEAFSDSDSLLVYGLGGSYAPGFPDSTSPWDPLHMEPGVKGVHDWNTTLYSSADLEAALAASPVTPCTTSSLSSELDSALNMSRSPSYAGGSYALFAGQDMAREGSHHSTYSYGSDAAHALPYGPAQPQVHPLASHHLFPSSHNMTKSFSNQSSSSSSSTQSYQAPLLQSPTHQLIHPKRPVERRINKSSFLCQHCEERPQGFRGEHELIRHIKLRHEPTRTMWICVAPRDYAGSLDSCKHCRDGKRYGAYYNAAQHIRRCHFAPIKRGRRSKADASAASELKAQLRERKFPTMTEMKRFLKQVITDQDGNVLSGVSSVVDESETQDSEFVQSQLSLPSADLAEPFQPSFEWAAHNLQELSYGFAPYSRFDNF